MPHVRASGGRELRHAREMVPKRCRSWQLPYPAGRVYVAVGGRWVERVGRGAQLEPGMRASDSGTVVVVVRRRDRERDVALRGLANLVTL